LFINFNCILISSISSVQVLLLFLLTESPKKSRPVGIALSEGATTSSSVEGEGVSLASHDPDFDLA
jgi:hypothetical protein